VFYVVTNQAGSSAEISFNNLEYIGNGEWINGATLGGTTTGIPYTENVDIASSTSNNLIIVAQPDAYSLVPASKVSVTSTIISDAEYTSRGAGDVEFLDNFFIFREPQTGRFFSADLGSSTAFSALNFATAETNPDDLVGMKSDKSQLLLFGGSSIEIWDTTGGTGFPFRKIINGTIEKGCLSARSVKLLDNRVFWIADDKTVRTLSGMDPIKISTPAVEQVLESDPAVKTARGLAWNFEGHSYYGFRTAQNCMVYDLTTGMWHRRRSPGTPTWNKQVTIETPNGPLFGGAAGEGWLSDLEPTGYGDSELVTPTARDSYETQEMEWTYQPVYGDGQRVFHDRLEMIMKTGVGTTASPAPVCQLEVSDDGGTTWQAMPDRAIGAQGKTFQRVVWHNLGSSYQRVYRARIAEQVPVTITDTILHAKGGRV
jgi:hypothetical protein